LRQFLKEAVPAGSERFDKQVTYTGVGSSRLAVTPMTTVPSHDQWMLTSDGALREQVRNPMPGPH